MVVVDEEELGLLAAGRLAAIESLSSRERLLIAGYAGADPDVYKPLLDAAATTSAAWACLSLGPSSPVPADTAARRIELRLGRPNGLAVPALRELLELDDAPGWPEAAVDVPWRQRLTDWTNRLLHKHAPVEFAHAWAWLLADAGDLDRAAAVLAALRARRAGRAVELRLAEVLYTRARGNDRPAARRLYVSLAATAGAGWPTRAHALIRIGGIARGEATRGISTRGPINAAVALAMPLIVLAIDRYRGVDPAITASGYGELQQAMLRLFEFAAIRGRRLWPLVALGLRVSARIGEKVEISPNGNRRALARSHRLLAQALSALLTGRHADDGLVQDLEALRDTYHRADDYAGAANCVAALAVVALSRGKPVDARRLLARARELYAAGRPRAEPLPSGAALLERLERLAVQAEAR